MVQSSPLDRANQFLRESGLLDFRVEQINGQFQLQLFHSGQWWGGAIHSDPLQLVQFAQELPLTNPVLEQIPQELAVLSAQLTAQLTQIRQQIQSYRQETSRRLLNAEWFRSELAIVTDALFQSVALLLQVQSLFPSDDPFPTFSLITRRQNSALNRAERIFQAIWIWNLRHPQDRWAVNLGLLIATFQVNQRAAVEFLNANAEMIEAYHRRVGIQNSRSQNRRKDLAPFREFVFQVIESPATLYLEQIEQNRAELTAAIVQFLSDLRASATLTLQRTGDRATVDHPLFDQLRQRPLSPQQIQSILSALAQDYAEKQSAQADQSQFQSHQTLFSLEQIQEIRCQITETDLPVYTLAIELDSGEAVVAVLGRPVGEGGLTINEIQALQQWIEART